LRSLLLALCFALATTVAARAAAPLGLPDAQVHDNVVRTVLSNGLTVLVVEDHSMDVVGMEMLFRVGQVDENDSNAGITHLIQNILQKRITHESGNGNDDNGVEKRGALLSVNAQPDYADIALQSDGKNFLPLLDAIAGAVARPTFTDTEVSTERDKLVKFLESDQRVFRTIYEIFLIEFYRYHPYRQPQEGHAESVRQLTTSKIAEYYKKFWAPNNTVVAVVGNVDGAKVVKEIRAKMGGLTEVEDKQIQVSWEPKAVEKELYLSSGSNLAWIFLGYPAPGMKSPEYMPMKVMQTILGDGLSSRLWVDLRERHGLAYELGSLYPQLEGPSHMIAYIITTPKQLGESQDRMMAQVKRIRDELVTPEELSAAKRRIIGQYLLERETNKGRAFDLAIQELLGGGYQADLHTVDDLKRVTAEDVQRVARAYLHDYTLVVARPRSAFDIFH
jgi:predicted Zn-dependent peptidase